MELKKQGIWIVNFTKEFWHSKEISLSAKGIYAILKSFINYNKSEAFPSLEYLSALSGLNERTIRRHIAELKQKNFIEVKKVKSKGKFLNNLYILKETEAEKIKYVSKNHRTKTTYDKTGKKTIGQKTTGRKCPTKINTHIKDIIGIANFLFNTEQNITALSKIINKFKRELSEQKLRQVIGYLWGHEKTFNSINDLAAYLQKCKPEEINFSFNPVRTYEQT